MSSELSRVRQRVSDIISQWHKTQRPNARAVMNDLPELRSAPSLVIDLAYEEFCLRSDAGENLDTKTFCGQFPTVQYSLARMIDVHHVLRSKSLGLNPCPETNWPEPGTRWLDWDLVEPLGRGAFSRVFIAREHAIGDREVVLKVTLSGPHEASILGRLSHVNIGPVHSLRRDDATSLAGISMPLLGRRTLADVLNRLVDSDAPSGAILTEVAQQGVGRSSAPSHFEQSVKQGNAPADETRDWEAYVESVVATLEKVARALDAAHRAGIIHGDIKPSNILLTFTGEPILLDFNLSGGTAVDFAHLGGTPPYMAPERFQQFLLHDNSPEPQTADARGDLFSLGVVMLELLQGPLALHWNLDKDIPQEADYLALLNKPALAGNAIEPQLQAILARCLAFDFEGRYGSAKELADELAAWLEQREQSRAKPITANAPPPARSIWKRYAPGVGVIVVASLSLVVFLSAASKRQQPSASHEDKAQDAVSQARRLIQSGDYLEAAHLLRREDLRDPSAELKAWTGYCFAQAKQYDAARPLLVMALAQRGKSAELWNDLGHCDMQLKRSSDAQLELDRSIQLDPRQQAAFHNRALLRMNAGNDQQAALAAQIWSDFEKAISQGQGSGRLHFDAATFLALAAKGANPPSGNLEGQVVQSLAWGESPKSFQNNRFLFGHLDLPRLERQAKELPARTPRKEATLLLPPPFSLPDRTPTQN